MDARTTSTTGNPALIGDLLTEQLQDLLSAEGQVAKALPRMIQAAHADELRMCFEAHLEETRGQIERLKDCLKALGAAAAAKPCAGMAGLLEEGTEVMAEVEERAPEAADLALIAAAQKVEHYEMSGYTTARTLAAQIGAQDVARLLNLNLAEEATADSLLTQIARELMSASRTGVSKDDELTDGRTGSRKRKTVGGRAASRSAPRRRQT